MLKFYEVTVDTDGYEIVINWNGFDNTEDDYITQTVRLSAEQALIVARELSSLAKGILASGGE